PERLARLHVADPEGARLDLDRPLPERSPHRERATGARGLPGESVPLGREREPAGRVGLALGEAGRLRRERRHRPVEAGAVAEVHAAPLRLQADQPLTAYVLALVSAGALEEEVIQMLRVGRDRSETQPQLVARSRALEGARKDRSDRDDRAVLRQDPGRQG